MAAADHNVTPGASQGLARTAVDDALAETEAGVRALDEAPAVDAGPPPARIGRFVILKRLGAGGMGTVWSAYDPRLQRVVAVKLLRDRDSIGADPGGRERLRREARAMAKIDHPNVLSVFEVDEHDGHVFVAMELVNGRTLKAWLAERRRPWRELVAVFEQAGRGLVAAHQQGLIHRDFKPENVMIGRDDRVRVMDFGLARLPGHLAAGEDGRRADTDPDLVPDLTRAGSVLGTPAYMAPEQYRGTTVDARTNQFSFCVALWEAVHGARPFSADSQGTLEDAVVSGRRRPAPPGRRSPRWLTAALDRGLRVAPDERFASMQELLAALARGQALARRRVAVAAVAAVAVLGGGVMAYRRHARARTVASCRAEGGSIAEVWNDAARARVRGGLEAAGRSQADATAALVMPHLDAYASAWRTARIEACLDTRVRARWTDDLLDRAQRCLDERRMGLEALVEELSRADGTTVLMAVSAAAGLAPLEACRDARRLVRTPRSPAQGDQVRQVRRALSRADALRAAGRYHEALAVVTDALADASTLGWAPLLAGAMWRRGLILQDTGQYVEAEAQQQEAYFAASRSGDQEIAADAAIALAYTVAFRLARVDDGRRWGRHAEVALATVEEPATSLRTAAFLDSDAHLRWMEGGYDQALARNQQALAIRERALGPDHPQVATSLDYLANAYRATGDAARATPLHERALAIRRRALGPDHPDVASSLVLLGDAAEAAGDVQSARALYAEALAIVEAALGPDHAKVGGVLVHLAALELKAGDLDVAWSRYQRALASLQAEGGEANANLAWPLTGLAEVALAQGRPADALPLAERAVRLREAAGTAPDDLARSRFALTRAVWEAPVGQGRDRPRALALAARATAEYRGAGHQEAAVAEVEAWVAEHVGVPPAPTARRSARMVR